jgi:hypothetical protein
MASARLAHSTRLAGHTRIPSAAVEVIGCSGHSDIPSDTDQSDCQRGLHHRPYSRDRWSDVRYLRLHLYDLWPASLWPHRCSAPQSQGEALQKIKLRQFSIKSGNDHIYNYWQITPARGCARQSYRRNPIFRRPVHEGHVAHEDPVHGSSPCTRQIGPDQQG